MCVAIKNFLAALGKMLWSDRLIVFWYPIERYWWHPIYLISTPTPHFSFVDFLGSASESSKINKSRLPKNHRHHYLSNRLVSIQFILNDLEFKLIEACVHIGFGSFESVELFSRIWARIGKMQICVLFFNHWLDLI